VRCNDGPVCMHTGPSLEPLEPPWLRQGGSRGSRTPPLCQNFFYSINKLVVCFTPPAPRSQISDNEPPIFKLGYKYLTTNPHFQTLATPLCITVDDFRTFKGKTPRNDSNEHIIQFNINMRLRTISMKFIAKDAYISSIDQTVLLVAYYIGCLGMR
jgi:hypothetical protein